MMIFLKIYIENLKYMHYLADVIVALNLNVDVMGNYSQKI
jgi:hypothetical protein